MTTAHEISPEEMAAYREGARRRREAEQRALAVREKRAWELARQAAAALREQFGVERVVVFGSLVHPGCFTPWSDVDIAAWGLRPDDTFRAIGVAMDLDTEIPVNLVDVNCCRASILRVIEEEGMPI
jgi:predicted nucleotidyltransferase